jgi:single-stranded-DNA-specific exonuclease
MPTRQRKRWLVHEQYPQEAQAAARDLGVTPALAQILLNRGLRGTGEMRSFLTPNLNALHDTALLPDIRVAVERIDKALVNRERIIIYGDYDVDGISATALLVRFFRLLGHDVEYYVPRRIEEGYGLNIGAIERLAKDGTSLLITVDCGISDVAEIERASQLGMTVIVTDHHEQADQLPRAHAIVNPKRRDSKYPFRDLSGVGVAFKLAWAFVQRLSDGTKGSGKFSDFLVDSVGLVALGTVADIVPLLDENRVFAHYGLQALAQCDNPGVRALIKVSNLEGKQILTHHVGFRLGPRLNAGGRLGSADASVELLAAAKEPRSSEIAAVLDCSNRERQHIEAQILDEAVGMLKEEPSRLKGRVLVLSKDDWHCGVLGIVASKLVDMYHRPAILVSFDSGEGRGSGRSIPGFHLHQALLSCRETMISCGGHAMAAGLRIERRNMPALQNKINIYAENALSDDDLVPALRIDVEISLLSVCKELVRELGRLEPCGVGNRSPLFVTRGMQIAGEPRVMGNKGEHLSFHVTQGATSARAVAFGLGSLKDSLSQWKRDGRLVSLVYEPTINSWQGMETVELHVKDIDASGTV